VHTVKPELGQTVYDPCCGTGGFLAVAFEHINKSLGKAPASTDLDILKHDTFYGREKENLVLPIALANLVLHGIDQPNLWHGNTLTKRTTYGALFENAPKTFDVILTNPPFGGKEGKDAQKNYAFETAATQVLFVQDILSELAQNGNSGIVLDEGFLFRTNETAFVETKRKLVDECNLWAIVSLPGGVFSTAGAGVKTNLLFFTKGRKTGKTWYYDLSHVKIGKKTPMTLAHFGFDDNGKVLATNRLPANLVSDWLGDENNNGKEFPSYARMIENHGKHEGNSYYSWTIDFADKRAKAREAMQPFVDEIFKIKNEIIGQKEELKRLKLIKADKKQTKEKIKELDTKIKDNDKLAREQQAKADEIDAAVFDLKAVNPNIVAKVDTRTPTEIIKNINAQQQIVSDAMKALTKLLN
jgi:type I restriction enzyme M protein